MSLIDDALGQGVMIVGDRTNLPVGKREVLSFERIAAAHDFTIDGNEIFIVDTRICRPCQPARLRPAIKHHVLVLASLEEALIKLCHSGFVLGTIRLDNDGHESRDRVEDSRKQYSSAGLAAFRPMRRQRRHFSSVQCLRDRVALRTFPRWPEPDLNAAWSPNFQWFAAMIPP